MLAPMLMAIRRILKRSMIFHNLYGLGGYYGKPDKCQYINLVHLYDHVQVTTSL